MKKKTIRKHQNIKELQKKTGKLIRNSENNDEISSNTSEDKFKDDEFKKDKSEDDTFKDKSLEEKDAAVKVIKITENLKNVNRNDAENDQAANNT